MISFKIPLNQWLILFSACGLEHLGVDFIASIAMATLHPLMRFFGCGPVMSC